MPASPRQHPTTLPLQRPLKCRLQRGTGLWLESHVEQELGLDVLGGQEGWGTALQLLPRLAESGTYKACHPNPSQGTGEGQPPSCRDAPVGEAERGVGGP